MMPVTSEIRISVVTPTLDRPEEVQEMLTNLSKQNVLPAEVIIVDGANESDTRTEQAVTEMRQGLPFQLRYIRHSGGTAIQRNVGMECETGEYVAFIDDDIRLEPDFFERIIEVFKADSYKQIGGAAGYIKNQYLDPNTSPRWKWYKRLRIFSTYEPGRYDFKTGYPINRYLQPMHDGVREIDFMGSGCVLWRKEVIRSGLRFARFFTGYGILEDAHFSLQARKRWKLVEVGKARCVHLHARSGREDYRQIARKSATNYRYVFMDIVPQRTKRQEIRFWFVQVFDLFRFILHALRHPSIKAWSTVVGKIEGIVIAMRLPYSNRITT